MGIVERRERLRKQVRHDILKTARDIAREEGWQAVSIRKIADVIEYSPPILYEYFDSKDKLLETIRNDGFAFLHEELLKLRTLYRNPEKLITEFAQIQWRFMHTQTEVFQVMFNMEGGICQSKQAYQIEFAMLNNHPVWEAMALIRPRSADAVSKTFYEWWCLTYGFLVVTSVTQPRQTLSNFEPIFMETVRRFVRGLA
ncbi:TetR/AcrR family transcriptional regulator [Runella rosea]|jgi:AcrR family transcriptional regulator|uniref:TetR/AcrR family transcriptional regulator n=2 Tax=Runella TaxID=105 RepID=A0A344TE76_9BACT|nr:MULTISPECIES: TetR/AcrR family transcriptional regulator [Runella]AXE16947.1 TetR/AcrR family transcriptional regulator [Runella rosea]RDB03391.1 TetR/AcrR family transcriptional regulator [Runella aurantiaca]